MINRKSHRFLVPGLAALLAVSGLVWFFYQYPLHAYRQAFVPEAVGRGDWFGSSLAIEGESAIVSAFYDDHAGRDSGNVYYLALQAGEAAILDSQVLDPPGLQAGDEAGFSTALQGDRFIIGSIGGFARPPGDRTRGRVLLYALSAGVGEPLGELSAPDGEPGDYFGFSVDIDERTLAVGAKHDDDAGENAGAVYVYDWPAESHVPELRAKLLPAAFPDDSRTLAGAEFGTHVAVHGDTLVVGAPFESGRTNRAGAIRVYERSADEHWILSETLVLEGSADNEHFGVGVDISDNLLVVGASHWADDGRKGRAFVFERDSSGRWSISTELSPPELVAGDLFGMRVVTNGRYVAVGAHGDDTVASGAGAVYLFVKDEAGQWQMSRKYMAEDGRAGDHFGISLAMSDTRLLVGAEAADVSGRDSGAVYLFDLP